MVRKRIVKKTIEQFDMKISELLEEYITELQVNQCSIHTIKTYETAFKRFICDEGDLRLSEINMKVINHFKKNLKDNVSPRTINTYISHLRAVFNYAYKQEYMDKLEIKLIKVQQKVKYVPTDEEIEILLSEGRKETYSNYVCRLACMVMCTTGIRCLEFLSLNIGNFTKEYISTNHTKNRMLRYLPIPNLVSKEIRSYIKNYRKDAKQDDPLFVSVYLRRYTDKGFRKSFRDFAKKKIGHEIGTHCLRRYFITKSLNNNANPILLAKITGHHDTRMFNYYYKCNINDLIRMDSINTIADLNIDNSHKKMLRR
ncbi:tyrosine-type recombinase/integrase [Clostridium perfringens]|uniref:tyrosine-type recombinase/integrase n=1 Tax=Clostridium perfringens TaxID=1502 RepID=UPI0029717081|nr:tyrosine-type recombinase/integrase [Clostridium perfringens]MDM0482962.1 tyrosine-type recombinase/integrase [Clostridium perfringens]